MSADLSPAEIPKNDWIDHLAPLSVQRSIVRGRRWCTERILLCEEEESRDALDGRWRGQVITSNRKIGHEVKHEAVGYYIMLTMAMLIRRDLVL